MPYIYDCRPGGDRLSVTRCEEHGGLIVAAHAYSSDRAVPVCIAPEDVAEVIGEMAEWAGLTVRIEPQRCGRRVKFCPECGHGAGLHTSTLNATCTVYKCGCREVFPGGE
jgi:hypothetical protein